MLGWTLVDTHPIKGRTFQRPLDPSELSFFWEALFNGTTDNLQHFELRLLDSSQDAHLFSTANIIRAWLSAKRRYPLVGARIQGYSRALRDLAEAADSPAESDGNATGLTLKPYFLVQEHDLSVLRPREIIFETVNGREEAQRRVASIMQGPGLLSEDLLAQLYVIRDTERANALHFVALTAHCVADGTAGCTLMRCLMDTLARGGSSEPEPAQISLEDRLMMAVPSTEHEPLHLRSLSPAKRRWRRAVGAVILQLMIEKRQGGHTLPCRVTKSTPHVAARPGHLFALLTPAESAVVLANCRLHKITFGNAYLPLAQVAMTRVLYRRYLRGEISGEEWEYRRRQPYISGGPLNSRPYLDKEWFDNGGGGEVMISIGFFFYQLPFMTLGAVPGPHQRHGYDHESTLSDGAPPFDHLLSFGRFLHRAQLVKKQATALFNHPLFFEIGCAANQMRVEPTRITTLQWMKRAKTRSDDGTHRNSDKDEALSVTDMSGVWAHGGSSIGIMDLVVPSEYPVPPTHPLSPYSSAPHPMKAGYTIPPPPSTPTSTPTSSSTFGAVTTPKIVVEHERAYLHTRPSQLYLGAWSLRGQLTMFAYYDGNVFEDGIVKEWLDEVQGAVLWYLGRTHHRSRSAGKSGGGNGGSDRGVRPRL